MRGSLYPELRSRSVYGSDAGHLSGGAHGERHFIFTEYTLGAILEVLRGYTRVAPYHQQQGRDLSPILWVVIEALGQHVAGDH